MPSKLPPVSTKAILTVGDGRGFVIEHGYQRLVITAAHCLPFFPPCHGASYTEERTYQRLLAPLGGEPAIWAECLFADPIADIAVLGSPDNQELFDQALAYEALVEAVDPFAIADAPEEGSGWLLSLEQEWFGCTVKYIRQVDGPLCVCNTAQPIKGGMSGSPIVSGEGAAIGVINLSSNPGGLTPEIPDRCEGKYGLPNSRLYRDLPGWLLRPLLAAQKRAKRRQVKEQKSDQHSVPTEEGISAQIIEWAAQKGVESLIWQKVKDRVIPLGTNSVESLDEDEARVPP